MTHERLGFPDSPRLTSRNWGVGSYQGYVIGGGEGREKRGRERETERKERRRSGCVEYDRGSLAPCWRLAAVA